MKIKLSSGYEVPLESDDLFEDLDHLVGAVAGETGENYPKAKGVERLRLMHQEVSNVAAQLGDEPRVLKKWIVDLLDYCVRNEIKSRMHPPNPPPGWKRKNL